MPSYFVYTPGEQEPRCQDPCSGKVQPWIQMMASYFKSLDSKHMVTGCPDPQCVVENQTCCHMMEVPPFPSTSLRAPHALHPCGLVHVLC